MRLLALLGLPLFCALAQDRIPAFELSDQHGKRQTLESLRGPKGLMLVFFRSADW